MNDFGGLKVWPFQCEDVWNDSGAIRISGLALTPRQRQGREGTEEGAASALVEGGILKTTLLTATAPDT